MKLWEAVSFGLLIGAMVGLLLSWFRVIAVICLFLAGASISETLITGAFIAVVICSVATMVITIYLYPVFINFLADGRKEMSPEEFIEEFCEKVNWNDVPEFQKLSEKFVEEFRKI
jgi:hypothetical protein